MSNETAIPVTVESASHKGRFFILEAGFFGDGIGPGLEIANEERLLVAGMPTLDPPTGAAGQYPEMPHLVHVPAEGEMPRDFEELAGIWIVSDALKEVFEAVDREAFAFVACDFTLADGSVGPNYSFCNVVPSLDALDVDASKVKLKHERDHETGEDIKIYRIAGGASLVFKEDVVKDAHIFRQAHMAIQPVCDRAMFEALRAANLSGVRLRDAADL